MVRHALQVKAGVSSSIVRISLLITKTSIVVTLIIYDKCAWIDQYAIMFLPCQERHPANHH